MPVFAFQVNYLLWICLKNFAALRRFNCFHGGVCSSFFVTQFWYFSSFFFLLAAKGFALRQTIDVLRTFDRNQSQATLHKTAGRHFNGSCCLSCCLVGAHTCSEASSKLMWAAIACIFAVAELLECFQPQLQLTLAATARGTLSTTHNYLVQPSIKLKLASKLCQNWGAVNSYVVSCQPRTQHTTRST